ncbi:MAG: bacteriophage Gp15 family protein [Oscillospiraceae bacterium]|jgi:hypothetical protein|nr:bacteriophage Gp15 family protein [Oscillospiraceae bacterium]
MSSLLKPLPDAVMVDGRGFPIYTDYRDWIEFHLAMQDTESGEMAKIIFALSMFKEETPENIEAAIGGLIDFMLCGESRSGEESVSPGKRYYGYDFEADSKLIYAAFVQVYNIDLYDVSELHWWKFMALLSGMPDNTRIAQIMSIINQDTSEMQPKERLKHERLVQQLVAGRKEHDSARAPKSLEEYKAVMMEKIQKIKTETES